MRFSRPKYWSGLPFPPQGIFLTQGSNLLLLYLSVLAGKFFTSRATWEASVFNLLLKYHVLNIAARVIFLKNNSAHVTSLPKMLQQLSSLYLDLFFLWLLSLWCFLFPSYWLSSCYSPNVLGMLHTQDVGTYSFFRMLPKILAQIRPFQVRSPWLCL